MAYVDPTATVVKGPLMRPDFQNISKTYHNLILHYGSDLYTRKILSIPALSIFHSFPACIRLVIIPIYPCGSSFHMIFHVLCNLCSIIGILSLQSPIHPA